jgi:exodeoxyribonuclease VII large subunit
LKRGFSITLVNGKAITDESEAKTGEELTTLLYNGTIKSIKE